MRSFEAKAVMAVNKGQISPQVNLNKLNDRVKWEESELHVVRDLTSWDNGQERRRAAVCCYGYGGTVTHAIVEQSPRTFREQSKAKGPTILVISAPQEKRIPAQCEVQAAWIGTAGQTESLLEISSTLAQRRAQHDFRATFVIDDHLDAAKLLNAHARGEHNEWVSQGRTLGGNVDRGVVWISSGHGAQWPNMGKELLSDPVFHEAILVVDRVVSDELGWSVLTALERGHFSNTEEIQVLTYERNLA